MAPFKLKFRMGGQRSTSQENDNDPQNNYNEHLTNNSQTNLFQFGSNTTIDSEVITGSTGSLNNDQRALLHNGDDGRIGYSNPTLTHTETSNHPIPLSPPPSYETVLEENRLAAIDLDKNSTNLCNNFIHTVNMLGENTLTPPNKHQDSIDSSLYSCTSTAATTPSQDNNMMTCNGSCDQIYSQHMQSSMDIVTGAEQSDPLNNHNNTSNQLDDDTDNNEYNTRCSLNNEYECDNNSDSECHSYVGDEHDYEPHHQQQQPQTPQQPVQEIIYKSSKELYKAVAKQSGIYDICKMSDQCRCLDCQSCYFDCEYDQNENDKTDGGLGAGTPMFISEVMHGSACTIL